MWSWLVGWLVDWSSCWWLVVDWQRKQRYVPFVLHRNRWPMDISYEMRLSVKFSGQYHGNVLLCFQWLIANDVRETSKFYSPHGISVWKSKPLLLCCGAGLSTSRAQIFSYDRKESCKTESLFAYVWSAVVWAGYRVSYGVVCLYYYFCAMETFALNGNSLCSFISFLNNKNILYYFSSLLVNSDCCLLTSAYPQQFY